MSNPTTPREMIASLRREITEMKKECEEERRENAALRTAAVEVCALARVWVTVWGDKLSVESIKRLGELEKQILKEAKP